MGDADVLLAGRYRLGAVLGRGGMGTVHRAEDERLGRPVAVKLLPPAAEHHGERLRREAKVLARLDHPSLVRVLDVDEEGDRPFIVMELVDGTTLAERLREGPLDERRVREIGAEIADGIAHAHAEGVVHRDLKPANIVLGEVGPARIIDFGIARIADATGLTDTGTILGTAAYLAPEQFAGGGVGPPADVYTLGLVLIEALTGRRAFDGDAVESVAARLEHPPDLPSGLDEPWPELLLAMTSVDPDRRPSAADVAERLTGRAAGTEAGTGTAGPADDTVVTHPTPAPAAVTEPIGITAVLPAPAATDPNEHAPARPLRGAGRRLAQDRRTVALLGAAAVVLLMLVGIVALATGGDDDPAPAPGDDAVPADLADALDDLEEAVGR